MQVALSGTPFERFAAWSAKNLSGDEVLSGENGSMSGAVKKFLGEPQVELVMVEEEAAVSSESEEEEHFEELDTNHDGVIDREEYASHQAARPPPGRASLAEMDSSFMEDFESLEQACMALQQSQKSQENKLDTMETLESMTDRFMATGQEMTEEEITTPVKKKSPMRGFRASTAVPVSPVMEQLESMAAEVLPEVGREVSELTEKVGELTHELELERAKREALENKLTQTTERVSSLEMCVLELRTQIGAGGHATKVGSSGDDDRDEQMDALRRDVQALMLLMQEKQGPHKPETSSTQEEGPVAGCPLFKQDMQAAQRSSRGVHMDRSTHSEAPPLTFRKTEEDVVSVRSNPDVAALPMLSTIGGHQYEQVEIDEIDVVQLATSQMNSRMNEAWEAPINAWIE